MKFKKLGISFLNGKTYISQTRLWVFPEICMLWPLKLQIKIFSLRVHTPQYQKKLVLQKIDNIACIHNDFMCGLYGTTDHRSVLNRDGQCWKVNQFSKSIKWKKMTY